MDDPDLPAPSLSRRRFIAGSLGAACGMFIPYRLIAAEIPTNPMKPITTWTLKESLHHAGNNLVAMLNPEDRQLPYWMMSCGTDYRAELARWWPAHNLGRWWDAMFRLEAAIGYEIPHKAEVAMKENTRRFFDNPDCISLNPEPAPAWLGSDEMKLIWDIHSLREGLLALHGLARWRKDDWAADMGRKMIESLESKLNVDGSWNVDAFDACKKRGRGVIHNFDPCDTHGRLIEALIWFYQATGEPAAIRFAHRLAEWHFENTTLPDGTINPKANADHTHSYFGTLRGLLLYGAFTKQHQFIDRIAATYRAVVPNIVRPSGYTSHNMVNESFGETSSPGDVVQLALMLGEHGYPEFLDDAERLVRSRLLPSQIREEPPLVPTKADGKDAHKNLAKRIVGAYGGCHSHAHGGKSAVTDVTSADAHTLADVYNRLAAVQDGVLQIVMHLDQDSKHANVICSRDVRSVVSITPKRNGPVAVRVPQWTPIDSLKVTVDGKLLEPTISGCFARTGMVHSGSKVAMEYDLPEKRTHEKGLGGEYEIAWRGDDIIGISPNSTFLPFYPSIKG